MTKHTITAPAPVAPRIESLRGDTYVTGPAVWLVVDEHGTAVSAHLSEDDARDWIAHRVTA